MIQQSNDLLGTTANNINTLSSSQTKPAQNSSQTQQEEAKLQSTDISPAYSVEISQEGASLCSQNSPASISDTTQIVSEEAQRPSQPKHAGAIPQQTDSSKAYSVEISQAGAKLSAASSISSDDDSDSSSSSTENLSQYSDSQLQQMLSEGKISQSDYNTETAKRKAEREAENAAIPTNNVMGNFDISKQLN